MSLLNHLFGNASEVNINELKNEFGDILIPEEDIVAAFRIFRDDTVMYPHIATSVKFLNDYELAR